MRDHRIDSRYQGAGSMTKQLGLAVFGAFVVAASGCSLMDSIEFPQPRSDNRVLLGDGMVRLPRGSDLSRYSCGAGDPVQCEVAASQYLCRCAGF